MIKIRIFESNVISVLLYGCETWKMTQVDEIKLDTFLHRSLRGPSQPVCIARQDTNSGYFLCHRNSDLTRLKEKAYLSVNFAYISNVLKVFSVKCLSEENLAYSVGRFVTNKLQFSHPRLLC